MSQKLAGLGARSFALLPPLAITTAIAATATTPIGIDGAGYLAVEAQFTYGSGGASVDAYVQTSFDQGVSWIDIMNFHFTTASGDAVSAVVATTALTAATVPGDGTLTANTIVNGLLGGLLRVKVVTTGTYAGGTSLRVDATMRPA